MCIRISFNLRLWLMLQSGKYLKMPRKLMLLKKIKIISKISRNLYNRLHWWKRILRGVVIRFRVRWRCREMICYRWSVLIIIIIRIVRRRKRKMSYRIRCSLILMCLKLSNRMNLFCHRNFQCSPLSQLMQKYKQRINLNSLNHNRMLVVEI